MLGVRPNPSSPAPIPIIDTTLANETLLEKRRAHEHTRDICVFAAATAVGQTRE
jgi:hypothetical protein